MVTERRFICCTVRKTLPALAALVIDKERWGRLGFSLPTAIDNETWQEMFTHTKGQVTFQRNVGRKQWRLCGLVVSASDFRSGGRWFKSGLCHRVVSSDKKLYFTLSLFTQVYKWVPAIIMLGGGGVTLRRTSIPSSPGGVGIFSVASCHTNQSYEPAGWPLARKQSFHWSFILNLSFLG